MNCCKLRTTCTAYLDSPPIVFVPYKLVNVKLGAKFRFSVNFSCSSSFFNLINLRNVKKNTYVLYGIECTPLSDVYLLQIHQWLSLLMFSLYAILYIKKQKITD
uniref:Uncharacterized protein n=1 Tax=Micrurus spixii TaxID=129469 RepID=A0A2D4LEA6_9SAUR